MHLSPFFRKSAKKWGALGSKPLGCCVDFEGAKFRKVTNSLTLGDSLYKGNISSEKEAPD
jgi:hypothetical protein